MRMGMMVVAAIAGSGTAKAADYVTIRHTAEVAGTPDAVWRRIGDYCGITKLLDVTCSYASGSGDIGTVRNLNNGQTMEPMVGRTAHSYTYGQFLGGMKDYDYHGTLAVEPAGRGRSTIVYTIVYDQAAMPSDDVRSAQHARIDARFREATNKAKAAAEGW